MKRYGPSRRRAQNASAALEIFAPHLKKSFATQSGVKRTCAKGAGMSPFDPRRTSLRAELSGNAAPNSGPTSQNGDIVFALGD
jgi:hypothetical protein